MQTLTEIRSRLAERGLSPRHRLGQNFLHDHNQLRKLLEAARVAPGDVVLEIGPGTGALTEPLLDLGAVVVACEIDPDLASLLQQHLGRAGDASAERFHLVEGDALRARHALNPVAVAALAARLTEGGRETGGAAPGRAEGAAGPQRPTAEAATFRLVANLPYGVASPIIAALLVSHGPQPPLPATDDEMTRADGGLHANNARSIWWRPLRTSGGGGPIANPSRRGSEDTGDDDDDAPEWETGDAGHGDTATAGSMGGDGDASAGQGDGGGEETTSHRAQTPHRTPSASALAAMFEIADAPPRQDSAARNTIASAAEADAGPDPEVDPADSDEVGVGSEVGSQVELGPPSLRPVCSGLYITIQKEVAERITAAPRTKAYGPLAVLCQALAEVRTISKLSPGCFWPQPKVWSAMIAIEPRAAAPVSDRHGFSNFLQVVFRSRRKQLGSILGRGQAVAWPAGVSETMRPEELSVAQLVDLFHALHNHSLLHGEAALTGGDEDEPSDDS